MQRGHLAWRFGGVVSMLTTLVALWVWLLTVEALNIDTQGVGGYITMALWTLYLFAVPLAGIVALLTAVMGAVRQRHSWRFATLAILVVVAAFVFWWWSITKAEV